METELEWQSGKRERAEEAPAERRENGEGGREGGRGRSEKEKDQDTIMNVNTRLESSLINLGKSKSIEHQKGLDSDEKGLDVIIFVR